MLRVLVPVDESRTCYFAVRHVIKLFLTGTPLEVHVLNVQPPFPQYVAQFSSASSRHEHHRGEAQKALHPAKKMLENAGVACFEHVKVGDPALCITDVARRLRCDRIVMSTARKNSLTRFVENSVTNKVLELTPVPVDVIPGDESPRWERYGIPAAIGALLSLFLAFGE